MISAYGLLTLITSQSLRFFYFMIFLALLCINPVMAAEPASCKNVRLAVVDWTDIKATTGSAIAVLKSLGYLPTAHKLSVPDTFESLRNREVDVFLGNWMPTMEKMIKPYQVDKSVETVAVNLIGAKFTLAVPDYLYKAGLMKFSDINKFKRELDGKIYGLEPGNDGNGLILEMLKTNSFGLKDWKLIESSEAEMLKSIKTAIDKKKPIVFLGWEPHPMNKNFAIKYLDGGDKFFGADFGGGAVFTNTRAKYVKECPNIGKFFKNLSFSLKQENEIMDAILNFDADPEKAGRAWLARHPKELEAILEGVKTFDGKKGKKAVFADFGIE